MKEVFFILLFFVLMGVAYAVPFTEISDATPPALPSWGLAEDDDAKPLLFLLVDGENNPVENIHLAITDTYGGEVTTTLQYVKTNKLIISLTLGKHYLVFKGDSLSTPGGDYYYQGDLLVNGQSNSTIQVLPVGSIRGTVIEQGGLAKGAVIKYDCGKYYGLIDEQETDSYGSFSNDYLPVGMCRIYARHNGNIGYVDDVNILPGDVIIVEIELNREASTKLSVYWILGLVIFLLLVIGLYMYIKKQPRKTAKKVDKQPARTTDLLKTLNTKEQLVVELLMNEGELYQNKITHSAGIPKTSLVRILMGLEQKKIIQITKIGKTKKIKLTNWFLNKEK